MKRMNSLLVKFFYAVPFVITPTLYAATNSELIFDMPVHRSIAHPASNYSGAAMAGAGYSHDTQQIPPNVCYNTLSSTTGQEGTVNLNTAMSFADFEKQLHFNVDVKGGYGMFSAEAEADYLRSIQDLDYSLSLNYSELLFDTVLVRLVGPGQKALTESGKDIYNDPNINKYFGVLCGDDFISSYQQGASLLMALNIRFNSHEDKEAFNSNVSVSFGNLVSASSQIQTMAQKYNIHGTVIIQAYQKGGNPAELSKVLSKDQSGVYYALSCDLQHMDNCVKAANGMLNYAVENFPKQISFNPDNGLVPLGTGFVKHDPIAEYGLTPPPSLVTKEVIDDRNYLASVLEENQYYQQKLNSLIMGYPVPWDSNSDIYKSAVKLYKKVTNNSDSITLPASPDDGALKCYNHPELCHATALSIKQQLQAVTATDINFLDPLKFAVADNFCGRWYPVNRPDYFMHYDPKGWYSGNMTIVPSASISNIALRVVLNPTMWTTVRGTLAYSPIGYVGRLKPDNGYIPLHATMTLFDNPYVFGMYKSELVS